MLIAAPAAAQRAGGGRLEAAPGVAPIRIEPAATYGAPPAARRAAWDRFLRATGATGRASAWQAIWDRDTLAPMRIHGAGIAAPGTVGHAEIAAAHARTFLEAHRDLLAPGTKADDFEWVANDLDNGLRTVAFRQRVAVDGVGFVPVIGGRTSFRYKNDRLFVIAAETFSVDRLPAPRIDAPAAVVAATAWVAEEHAGATLREAPALVALPLVGSGRVAIRGAYRVVLDAIGPRARWAVYVDARSGEPLAREDLLRFDQASVVFDVPVRAPQLGRQGYPATRLTAEVDGVAAETDAQGSISWAGAGAPADVVIAGARGPLVRVRNQAGTDASVTLSGADGETITWSLADDEYGDAQLTAFVHASLIKEHARAIAPEMTWLDGQLGVRPNVSDPVGCNAFWDGTSLNFYRQNMACNNSARVADVVYHEFGHGFHQNAVIPGAGALDPALGEAAGDTMSASYTHDPDLAPGFYIDGGALRHLTDLRRWPEDINGDPHETGIIWGGAMWDLRLSLMADLGDQQGNAITDQLYYQALRRSSSLPTTYAEILAADDDDGDLENGTPHICAINQAFLRHGLAPVMNEAGLVLRHTPLTVVPPGEGTHAVEVGFEAALSPVLDDERRRVGVDELSLPQRGPGQGHARAEGRWLGRRAPGGAGWKLAPLLPRRLLRGQHHCAARQPRRSGISCLRRRDGAHPLQ
ncbi:MAG: hypothetical protein QM820_26130 [Minicystis sp.]